MRPPPTATLPIESTVGGLLKCYSGRIANSIERLRISDQPAVVKAYTQWGKQPAEAAEWKHRVATDRVRLAALQP
jgi:hypothetical protein